VKNPPKGNIETPHKIPVISKSKRGKNKEGDIEGMPKEEIVLEYMDLDVNIEDIEFLDEEQRIQECIEVALELDTYEPIVFEEESLTMHSAMFDKSSRKLVIERVKSKNKKVQGKLSSELDFNGVPPSRTIQIHEAIG
jgi:hypothetical protein